MQTQIKIHKDYYKDSHSRYEGRNYKYSQKF